MSADCLLDVVMDDIVTSGVDAAVEGTLYASDRSSGTPCISVDERAACSYQIGGEVPVAFNENTTTVDGIDYQELTIIGDGLHIAGPITRNCLGSVRDGDPVTVQGGTFLVRTAATYQHINFSD